MYYFDEKHDQDYVPESYIPYDDEEEDVIVSNPNYGEAMQHAWENMNDWF